MSDEVPLTPAPGPARARPSFDLVKVILFGLGLLGAAGLAYGIYYLWTLPPRPLPPSPLKPAFEAQAGYLKMSDTYKDANGDLVADPPTDAKDFLNPSELAFATIPGVDQEEAAKVWEPFLELLAKKTGRPVKLLIDEKSSSPTASASAAPGSTGETGLGRNLDQQLALLKSGQLHIAAFAAGEVPRAVNTAGFVPMFVPASADGQFTVETVLIVPTKSTIASVADLKSKSVSMVSFNSTTGCKAPIVIFKEQFGLVPGRDYHYTLAGSHRESIRGVAVAREHSACVASDILEQFAQEEDGVKADKYKVIFRSGKFPPICFGVPHNLDPKLRASIEEAFKEFSFKGNSVGERFSNRAKFAPITYKTDFQSVREIDEKLPKVLE